MQGNYSCSQGRRYPLPAWKKYHVPLLEIMYSNPFVDIYNLQTGDELCIPVSLRETPN